jgi:hypothetical protein
VPKKKNRKNAARTAGKRTAKSSAHSKKSASARRGTPAKAQKGLASSTKSNLVIVGSGDRPIQEVAGDLRSAGLEVDQVMDAINQVTGRAAPALKARLKKIRGVADVSEEHEPFNIGPPGSPVS